MRKYFILLILILTGSSLTFAQETYYKSLSNIWLYNAIGTYDNGFACIDWNAIIKLDSNSQLQFYRKLNNDSNITFDNIIQSTDSGFIIESSNNPFNANGIGSVVKFDKTGMQLWTKRFYYPSTSSNELKGIVCSENDQFYLISGGCAGGPVLIKCNKTGDILWQKRSNLSMAVMKIIRFSGDKFLIGGDMSVNDNLQKICLTLVDTSGNFIWMKEYDNNSVNWLNGLIKTKDKGCSMLINTRDSGAATLSNNAIIHTDSTGEILWSRIIYTTETICNNYMTNFAETNDGGYLIDGTFNITSQIQRVLYMKIDQQKNIEWTRYFGNMGYNNYPPNEARNVFTKSNNYFVFAANCDGLACAKLDKNGYGFCNFDTIDFKIADTTYSMVNFPLSSYTTNYLYEPGNLLFNTSDISAVDYCSSTNAITENEIKNGPNYYPNPTTGNLTVEAENIKQIEVTDMLGKIIKVINAGSQNKVLIDLTEASKGIYFIKLSTDKTIEVKKIIKE